MRTGLIIVLPPSSSRPGVSLGKQAAPYPGPAWQDLIRSGCLAPIPRENFLNIGTYFFTQIRNFIDECDFSSREKQLRHKLSIPP